MTIHPDVRGRPQVLMMLERLIGHMLKHPGVRFVTLEEMAADFVRRSPPPAYRAAPNVGQDPADRSRVERVPAGPTSSSIPPWMIRGQPVTHEDPSDAR